MSNLLASIFSKADSLKRTLADAIAEPRLFAEQSIGAGIDRLNRLSEDNYTATSRSVLISPEQKEAANKRAINTMVDVVSGAGIIVPAREVLAKPVLSTIKSLVDSGKADEVYKQFKVFKDPFDNSLKQVIPDVGRAVDLPGLRAADGSKMVTDLVDTADLPFDLQMLMKQTSVTRSPGSGAYYDRVKDEIGIGADASDGYDMVSKLLHEMQHGSQYIYGMRTGGNPEFFFKNHKAFDAGRQIVYGRLKNMSPKQLNAVAASQKVDPTDLQAVAREKLLTTPELLSSVNSMLHGSRAKAYEHYMRLPGEGEARLVQSQFRNNNYSAMPEDLLDFNPKQATLDPLNVPKVDDNPITQGILNILLGLKPYTP